VQAFGPDAAKNANEKMIQLSYAIMRTKGSLNEYRRRKKAVTCGDIFCFLARLPNMSPLVKLWQALHIEHPELGSQAKRAWHILHGGPDGQRYNHGASWMDATDAAAGVSV